ncbi:MAG: hypothetical protein ABIZ80_02215 [Bryobacteraceae bacterium]
MDHALARALWETGNGDTLVLATMIAGPAAASSKELNAWMMGVRFRCCIEDSPRTQEDGILDEGEDGFTRVRQDERYWRTSPWAGRP